MTKRIGIIGSHGLYASYGGWDELVRNIAEQKSKEIEYFIFNSKETVVRKNLPENVRVIRIPLSASGFEGFFYDFISILICYWKVNQVLFLGAQGVPLIVVMNYFFKKVNFIVNIGGVEWERPKFNYFIKSYLKWCFKLSLKYSKYLILDNEYYNVYVPKGKVFKSRIVVIPYGGIIDYSLEVNDDLLSKYKFLNESYFLSVSRSLVDNKLSELCDEFLKMPEQKLVLISNFSKSSYGRLVLNTYRNIENITLINGLYNKYELDLVRRKCKAYIHTHTLCGTAPSLVEMIMARRPIISVDIPQNRFTLENQGLFYNSFQNLNNLIQSEKDLEKYIPLSQLCEKYDWGLIVKQYEDLYN
jgi:glycosyltransferase involved in cell wall biosynthesis